MPSVAFQVLEWLDQHPEVSSADRARVIEQVPAAQWAVEGGHWGELAVHCCNRALVPEEPRFMNRLSIYRMAPAARCLFRAPDGRGLAWLKSGGEVLAYGKCEQQHCTRAGKGPA